MKKYVFIDIDGTLYDYMHHEVPKSSIKALTMAKENGHELFICTGRPKPLVESRYLDLPISGIIYSGGAHIEVHNQLIFQQKFPTHRLMQVIDDMLTHHIEFTLEGVCRNYYSDQVYQMFKGYFCSDDAPDLEMKKKFEERTVICTYEDFTMEDAQQVTKIDMFSKDVELLKNYIQHLPEDLEGFVYSEPIGVMVEAEVLKKGLSKASGIDCVLEYFNAELKDTVAIGDSTNDVPMIQHAAIGIAMGNASAELKAIADVVTTNVDKNGLYNAFEKIGLI